MAPQKLHKDDAAQVGIGTMIVFIATILVAAVAAGVLIDTSQKLQDKSTQTGSDAISAVGTNLDVTNVWGVDSNADDAVEDLYIDIKMSPGADAIDLNQLSVHYTDGAQLVTYGVPAVLTTAAAGDYWVVSTLRDVDGSMGSGVMNDDDLVRLGIGDIAGADDLALGTATSVDVNIDVGAGAPLAFGFMTPNSYDSNAFTQLF